MNAITPVHNGAGEGLGLIDRPIIRERTTNIPFIRAHSIKGVFRDEYQIKLKSDPKINILFGPEDGDLHSGAVSFGAGNLLYFPIRSLRGCFVWATSPLLLYRFARHLGMNGKINEFPNLQNLLANPRLHSFMTEVLINPDSADLLLFGNKPNPGEEENRKIILEEFPKTVHPLDLIRNFAEEMANKIFSSPISTFLKEDFIKKMVILPEDTFSYFISYATEVVSNIKIDNETGTSKEGLRYTEYLPAETILYCIISFERGKCADAHSLGLETGDKVKELFDNNKPSIIQIGADETKGKGIVELNLST